MLTSTMQAVIDYIEKKIASSPTKGESTGDQFMRRHGLGWMKEWSPKIEGS
jgi:hypothetical protein